MKKAFFIFIFSLLFIIPIRTNALTFKNATIDSLDSQTIGRELNVTFKINFDEWSTHPTTTGIWFLTYDLDFDDDVLVLSNLKSELWDTKFYITDNYKFIFSEFKEDTTSPQACQNGILYCGNSYTITMTFFIKNTDKTSTDIRINEIGIALLDINDTNKTYTNNDIIEVSDIINQTKNITLQKITEQIDPHSIPNSIVSKDEFILPQTKDPTKGNNNINKSDNNFLKELKIKGHELNFDKRANEYLVYIEKDENNLNITAKPEDTKAKVNIVGNQDLKANDYLITIEVTAENETKNIYKIKAKFKEESNEPKKTNTDSITKNKIDQKIYYIFGGIITIFILIILIIIISNIINNKKIDKMLKKM